MAANKLTNFTKVLHKTDRASEVLVFDGQGNTSSVDPKDLVIGTATKLENPVQIDFQGDIQGALSFNGSEETPVVSNITVKDNSHNHTVDNVSGLRGEIDSKVDVADYKNSDVKLKYESNADTNAFTDSEKTKLSGIESGAEVNTVNSVLGQVGDVDLDTDDIVEGLTNQYFTTARARNSISVSGDLNYSGGVISFNETYSTPSEVKTAYESNLDTNVFSDSEKSKLSTVEQNAQENTITSVNGYLGAVNLSKSDVGLSSVTNDIQLKRDSNLSDVPNKATARSNLGLVDVASTGNFSDLSGELTEAQLSQSLAEKVNDTLPYNIDATTEPTANDDVNDGWKKGSLWINSTTQKAYRCVDNTASSAVWVDTSLSTSELATVALSGSYNDLGNKPSNATETVTGFMSASDKTKLNTVETGAEVNTVNSVAGKTGLVTLNTSDVSEGTNQYFTTSRARAAISVSGDLTYSNGVISFNETYSTPVDIKTAYESNTDTNAFTDSEKSKLGGIESGAEVNEPTNLGSSRTSVAYNVSSSTGSNTSLQAATTTLAGVMTAADKAKLDSVEEGAGVSNVDSVNGQTGTVSLSTDNIPEGNVNDYFTVTRARNSISVSGDLTYSNGVISFNETYSTPSEVKTAYESNANTNAFTDSEKSKLSGIEAGAEVNEVEEAPINGNQYARQDGGWTTIDVEEAPINGNQYARQDGGWTILSIPEGYTSTDFNTDFNSKSTDDLSEGTTNLYYTDARASNAAPVQTVSGKTGNVSLTSSDVGLGSVRNVSSYSQTEADNLLNGKLDTTANINQIRLSDYGYYRSGSHSTKSLDDDPVGGFGLWSASLSGTPSGARFFLISTQKQYSNSHVQQYAVSYKNTPPVIAYRTTTSLSPRTWTDWVYLYHTGNDGPGSGLDADTIDGYQAQDFAYPNQPQIANITLTGDFA